MAFDALWLVDVNLSGIPPCRVQFGLFFFLALDAYCRFPCVVGSSRERVRHNWIQLVIARGWLGLNFKSKCGHCSGTSSYSHFASC